MKTWGILNMEKHSNTGTSPNNIIEVYTTSISSFQESEQLKASIIKFFPKVEVSFDLEDCDKILRIGGKFNPDKIVEIAHELNILAMLLDD